MKTNIVLMLYVYSVHSLMVSDVIPSSRTSDIIFVDGGTGNMISDWSWVIYLLLGMGISSKTTIQ